MKKKRMHTKQSTQDGQKFHKTVWNDLHQGGLKKTFVQELKDIYHFYIDKDTKARLAAMGRIRRGLHGVYHVLKSMILKLTPLRRILLLIGVIIIGRAAAQNNDAVYLGILILLFILMLELKDKLLAHDELAAGRVVQFALMPKDNPDIAGWDVWLYTRPANEVSGDMVDYIWISENRLGLALGDVAGKGLGAAMFMAKLQATLRALAPITESLTKLGKQINTIFCRDGLPSRFISLVYIELQPDSDKIRILNAGHIPPICIKKNNMKELDQGGLALGLHPESRYEEQGIILQTNDLLVVYSDGLTEALNEKGAFFGEQRAQECLERLHDLSTAAIGERLLSEVNRFVGQARQSDDLSLIVLKRT